MNKIPPKNTFFGTIVFPLLYPKSSRESNKLRIFKSEFSHYWCCKETWMKSLDTSALSKTRPPQLKTGWLADRAKTSIGLNFQGQSTSGLGPVANSSGSHNDNIFSFVKKTHLHLNCLKKTQYQKWWSSRQNSYTILIDLSLTIIQ